MVLIFWGATLYSAELLDSSTAKELGRKTRTDAGLALHRAPAACVGGVEVDAADACTGQHVAAAAAACHQHVMKLA